MALAILDGTQTATTLSTILSSGQHITAHTVVSLGTQAITDMRGAVSGSVVSISNFPATQPISGTVTANLNLPSFAGANGAIVNTAVLIGYFDDGTGEFRKVDSAENPLPISGNVQIVAAIPAGTAQIGSVTVGNSVTIGSLPAISGTVTANGGDFASPPLGAYPSKALRIGFADDEQYNAVGLSSGGKPLPVILYNTSEDSIGSNVSGSIPLVISGTVTVGNTVTIAGTVTANPTGTQTIAGSVTIGAGTSQIGSVTASISSFATSVTARLINPAGTSVTYAEVGTAGNPSIDVLSVQGVTAGTPLNVYPMQGTTVSNTNFTSTTASTSLVSAVTGREVLTVFNEGAGNLHISPGATATTISYQVRLSAGDYWECPQGQLSLGHVAVFATAGTARVCQVS